MIFVPAQSIHLGIFMNATGKQNISKASHVDRARERLENAVVRLDQAIKNMPESSSGSGSQEQTGEIAALKAENAKLQETSRTVSGRLDQTIGKLKAVLKS